jgi:hypothetical protein
MVVLPAGAAGGVEAFQGNAALLSQLEGTAAALADVQGQVAAAEALLASSQAAALQAEILLEESAAEAAAAEQEMVLKTPAALARAGAMQPVVEPMLQAADSVLPLVKQGLAGTLKVLAGLINHNSAARDLAPIANETMALHGRCTAVLQRLHDIGSGVAGALAEMELQQQQQEQAVASADGSLSQQLPEAVLLAVLLQRMSPALAGVKEELQELGQVRPEGAVLRVRGRRQ